METSSYQKGRSQDVYNKHQSSATVTTQTEMSYEESNLLRVNNKPHPSTTQQTNSNPLNQQSNYHSEIRQTYGSTNNSDMPVIIQRATSESMSGNDVRTVPEEQHNPKEVYRVVGIIIVVLCVIAVIVAALLTTNANNDDNASIHPHFDPDDPDGPDVDPPFHPPEGAEVQFSAIQSISTENQ